MRGSFFARRICSEAVRGGVVAVRAPAGDLPPPDRRYTVAHRYTANLLGRFWCRSPQCRGGLCKKRQSFAQPTHGPQARHLSPKKERTKKFTFAHKRIHLHQKPPTKGVHLYNESPQNNHLRIQKRPNPRAAATSPVYCTTQNSPASSMPEQTSEAFTGMNTKKSAGKASSTV